MNTGPIHIERRAAQRFEFHLPVSIRVMGSATSPVAARYIPRRPCHSSTQPTHDPCISSVLPVPV